MADNSCTPTLDGLVGYDEAVQRLVTSAERLAGRRQVGLREALGERFCEVYEIVKKAEYDDFLQVISPWEREHLLLNV